MKIKELIKDLDYQRIEDIDDCEIKGISCNSQSVAPGHLFVAIKGERFDGHSFIEQAIDKGAKAVILEEDLAFKPACPAGRRAGGKGVTKILVRDSRTALACVCASFFGHPAKRLKVVGITGTNGKTSVSYLIEKIFTSAGHPNGVIGTINYRLGNKIYSALNTTPQADILQSFLQEIVLARFKYAIIEVSSHALAQHRVDYIDFSSAIFTNLSREHLDYHGNLDNYFSCKSTLFERLNPHSWSIINTDDAYGRKLAKLVKSRVLTFGIERPAQIRARDLNLNIRTSRFTATTPRGNIELESSLIGRHNVYNILAAVAVAFIEEIDSSHIVSGIKRCACVCGRMERVECGGDFPVFVDYAHTDDALAKVLRGLRQLSKDRIILVFGCGGDRDKAKRPRMGRVASELSDFVIITSDNPRSEDPGLIIFDIVKGIDRRKTNYEIVLDRFKAIHKAISMAGERDIVVIAGKGHESSQIFADRAIPFNDYEVVKKILQCLPLKKY